MNSRLNNHPAGNYKTSPTKETVVKIDNAIKSIPAAPSKNTKSAVTRLLQPAEPTAVSDNVQLTATAEKMRQLESDLGNLDITDSVKIASIRQAIAEGNFNVDEEAVAEGLIQESIAIIGSHSR